MRAVGLMMFLAIFVGLPLYALSAAMPQIQELQRTYKYADNTAAQVVR